jgi:hypothetical protein
MLKLAHIVIVNDSLQVHTHTNTHTHCLSKLYKEELLKSLKMKGKSIGTTDRFENKS